MISYGMCTDMEWCCANGMRIRCFLDWWLTEKLYFQSYFFSYFSLQCVVWCFILFNMPTNRKPEIQFLMMNKKEFVFVENVACDDELGFHVSIFFLRIK